MRVVPMVNAMALLVQPAMTVPAWLWDNAI
jgi:hypothetical protein